MRTRHDETGNYLVDDNGNDIACVYEMSVIEQIINARASALREAADASYDCREHDPGDYRDRHINEGVERCCDAIDKLIHEVQK